MLHLVVVSPIKEKKRKEKEKNINNDLGVFPVMTLTAIGLSSFHSLKPYFATVLLSMNIPVVLLSRSAFTMTSS